MTELEARLRSTLDAALEAIFSEQRHGGDHESRRLVAMQLIEAAQAGTTTLDGLVSVGRRTLLDLRNRHVR